jgi:large repetitive protein
MKVATQLAAVSFSVFVLLFAYSSSASAATFVVSPSSLSFGNVPINTTATLPLTATVDTGYDVHAVSGVTSEITIDFGTCSGFVGPGTCAINVHYTPATATAVAVDLLVAECLPDGITCNWSDPVHVTGTGVSAFAVSPSSLSFGNVPINTTATLPLTVTADTGYEVHQVSGVTGEITIDFGTCSGLVGPVTCAINVHYTPATPTAATTDLVVGECLPSSFTCLFSDPVHVTGTGVSALAVSPSSLSFGSVPINSTVTLPLTVTADTGYEVHQVSGVTSEITIDFGTCSGLVGPVTCSINVHYTPATPIAATADLVVGECLPSSFTCLFSAPVHVTGTGVSALAVSPSSLGFGSVPIGTTATLPLAVTADAGYEVHQVSGVTSEITIDFGTCSGVVGPITCSINVHYTPAAATTTAADLVVGECLPSSFTCLFSNAVHVTGTGVTPLVITTASLPSGTFGSPYPATTLTATGGTPPYHWSVSSGSLPGGLMLNATTGTITGTPTAAGTFTFTVSATDGGAPTPLTATKTFTISIIGVADVAISISTPTKPVAQSKLVTFAITVQNSGPTSASGVTVTNVVPAGSLFVSVTASQGNCATPPVGSTGTVICSLGSLANGGAATITLTVDPAIRKDTLTDTATVAVDASTIDAIASNNTATAIVQIK